jgi:hypothetical protein
MEDVLVWNGRVGNPAPATRRAAARAESLSHVETEDGVSRSTEPSNCQRGFGASPVGVWTWKKPLTSCGPSPSANGNQVIAESRGPVREVRAVKDEEYLYLRLRLDPSESWRDHPITIGLDTRPRGNRGSPNQPGVFPSADVALVVGPDRAQLFQAAWWEPTRLLYGPLGLGYIKIDPAELKPGSGAWVHPLQIVNKPYVVPATGEKRPVELHELDSLPIGGGDPSSRDFDNRTLVAAQGKVVEVRLPWALLGYSDPSSLLLYEVHPKGPTTTLKGGRVGIAVLSDGSALLKTSGYAWDPWQRVAWNERKKAGFDDLASTMRELSAPAGG